MSKRERPFSTIHLNKFFFVCKGDADNGGEELEEEASSQNDTTASGKGERK